MIHTKSIHSPVAPKKDGLRILATRFRGRGLPASRYDIWMPNLAPSETLLRKFRAGEIQWREFSRRYRLEIYEPGTIDRRSASIKNHGQKFTLRLLKMLGQRGTVTLLCHCDEVEPHCHRRLLQLAIQAV